MNKPTIGSVSEGTMRPEDLIPDFIWELKHREAKRLAVKYQREWETCLDEDGELVDQDAASDLLDQLFDRLNEDLPPYMYFGSHPGDGADYGYWVDVDSAIADQEADALNGMRLVVSDHGNVSLYYRNGREVWGVV